jgi:hypothetical protein
MLKELLAVAFISPDFSLPRFSTEVPSQDTREEPEVLQA